MKIKKLGYEQFVAKHMSRICKKTKYLFSKSVETIPVFVFGKQRSGTTMLMLVFELHPETEVFNEAQKSKAFLNFRIRDFETLEELTDKSKTHFICFKPICDSHLITEFIDRFPRGRFIWIYRDYRDVANSSLREFDHATRAIRIICLNQQGGGWFQEGVSEETAAILRDVYSSELTEFDMACLVWWARNRIFLEQNLESVPNLTLIKYEDIVFKPKENFACLFRFLGIGYDKRSLRYIHRSSIAKNAYPKITPIVQEMCKDLTRLLDEIRLEKIPKNI